ncbi:MAG: Holliday junction DNA helicase RuvA [Candidatus Reconcilbacillus cellulovorans]|uniref:Putative pre-16S rRNA nuclease n=1 Tax=Candidatus Reconcilbacillus cellulovorans TaxID=1906605 RepID=A0A2A6E0V3_9BACL|nr:MAG: Holliday junction DNA helicase RuvA [Candidatus Reconcilbacillus cellulovorans]
MTRVLGLDYGEKRIGVAVSDELGWTAQGVAVIERRDPASDLERIREIAENYGVSEIVVGLPKNMNGTVGRQGEICIAFARRLEATLKLPVRLQDERLTTAAAERILLEADVGRRKRRRVTDRLAAAVILQTYLDSRRKG